MVLSAKHGISEPAKYFKTPLTAVVFYTYDNTFDGSNGLYNAIYYNDKKLLAKYEKKYKGILNKEKQG